jgi:hypothetical protein
VFKKQDDQVDNAVRMIRIVHPFNHQGRKTVRTNPYSRCSMRQNRAWAPDNPCLCQPAARPTVMEAARANWTGRLNVRASFMSRGPLTARTSSVTSLFHVCTVGEASPLWQRTRTCVRLLWRTVQCCGLWSKDCRAIVRCLLLCLSVSVAGSRESGGSAAFYTVRNAAAASTDGTIPGPLSRFPQKVSPSPRLQGRQAA